MRFTSPPAISVSTPSGAVGQPIGRGPCRPRRRARPSPGTRAALRPRRRSRSAPRAPSATSRANPSLRPRLGGIGTPQQGPPVGAEPQQPGSPPVDYDRAVLWMRVHAHGLRQVFVPREPNATVRPVAMKRVGAVSDQHVAARQRGETRSMVVDLPRVQGPPGGIEGAHPAVGLQQPHRAIPPDVDVDRRVPKPRPTVDRPSHRSRTRPWRYEAEELPYTSLAKVDGPIRCHGHGGWPVESQGQV